MAKLTKASFVNAGDRIRGLPAAKRARIEALAKEMASELHLSEIRKALSITQKDLAERTGLAQGEVSRFENAELTGAKLGTLERYVEGMGGRLRLVAEMPDGTVAEIPMTRGKPVKSKISAARR
ncbi:MULTISPECIES: helix-turn-helix domain-containing protein [unclassified Roseovarius]|uniref:helix-turn-helix domain-containing protein n=1 Tax=unclassified Roseovarius TaxID=2614913 RepID=UPI0009B5634C|nr:MULTISPECIES: helix-turn-helix domain-containing protein [unclassified Roseovarius]MCQ0090580.1 helix-turn-helix transcriptional regulator [Roseovarius sp. M141]GAW37337.1 antitoxin HigA [Roseovarius sp. A-2]